MSSRLHRYGSALLVLLAVALGVWDLAPRGDLGVSDSAVERMRADLVAIASETRPAGSAANDRTRARIATELEATGLTVERQRWTHGDTELENLLARVPGEDPSGAVLVLAHHDSVARGPGAADDGAGVVAMLELARDLAAGPPPKQDVILLFSDGEELGLLGARHFRDHHPAMDDVRAVVNLEAMGGAGPAVCFQMSRGNAPLVDAWRSAPHPVGSSFAEVVYANMPNDTDLSVFLDRVPGMNYALAGGCSVYHRTWDTPERVEDRALRHLYGTLAAATRSLAGDEWAEETSTRNWFQFPLLGTFDWSETPPEWGMLSILGLLVVLDSPGTRARRLLAILRGALVAALLLVLALLPAFGLGLLLLFARGGMEGPTTYGEVHAMLALQGVWIAALLLLVHRWSSQRPGRNGLVLEASLAVLLLLALGGILYHVRGLGLRGADALPLRGAFTAAAVAFLAAQRTSGAARWIVGALLVVPALTFAPFLSILPQIGSQLTFAAAAMGAALWSGLLLLFLPLVVDQQEESPERSARTDD